MLHKGLFSYKSGGSQMGWSNNTKELESLIFCKRNLYFHQEADKKKFHLVAVRVPMLRLNLLLFL